MTNDKLLMKNIFISVLIFIFGAFIFAADVTPTAKAAPKARAAKKAAVKAAPAAVPAAVTAVEPQAVTQAAAPAETAADKSNTASLTYDDCVKIAADKNRDFKMAKLDKEVAEAQMMKATGSFGPTISIAGGYEPAAKLSSTLLPANSFGAGIPANDVAFSLMPMNYYSARVSLSQPLFTFGKLFFGFQMAQEGYKIAKINFKKAEEKLKLDIISSFYGAMIARDMAATMQESLKANEEYLRITRTKYANGQASNFDVLQAQVQYANSIPEAKRAEDGAMLALQSLKNTLAIPLDQEITLSGTPEYKKLDMAYDDIKTKFKNKNDDREMIEAAANIADYGKKLSAAMFLPSIALSANYDYYSTDSAFHREASYWQSAWSIMIGFQWTVFDSFKNVAAFKEASANEQKAALNRENMDNMLTIQLDQLYMSLDESRQIIEAADELIKTAEEGYRIAKENYRNGIIQSVDLLNAEIGLLRAKMNYLSAMYNYVTTVQKLKNYID